MLAWQDSVGGSVAPGAPAAPPADSTSAAWLLMSWYSWMNWYRFMMRDASIVPVSLLIWGGEGERRRDACARACACVCVRPHLGAEDPHGHLPQGRGVGSRLHLEQQVLLLADGELGRAEAEEPEG